MIKNNPESVGCSVCGRPNVVSRGRCSSCYQYFNKHKKDRDPSRIRGAASSQPRTCSVCGKPQVVSRGRCSSCYQYFNKHKVDRVPGARHSPEEPARACSVCKRPHVVSKGRCSSCYQYFNKNGRDRDPERARELYERSLQPKNRMCSNCNQAPASAKGRCAACYQYFRTHGEERDPANARRRRRNDRPPKEACVNGCELEPRTWAEHLWTRPYYGQEPRLVTLSGGEAKKIESGWLCATHYARWKKYPCVRRPPPEGARNKIRVYPRGMWICKGRTLSGTTYCPNVPIKLARFDATGELDYGKTEVDDLDVFLDGLCNDCRNAEQEVVYDIAVRLSGDSHPPPRVMKRALAHALREARASNGERQDGPEGREPGSPDHRALDSETA